MEWWLYAMAGGLPSAPRYAEYSVTVDVQVTVRNRTQGDGAKSSTRCRALGVVDKPLQYAVRRGWCGLALNGPQQAPSTILIEQMFDHRRLTTGHVIDVGVL